MVFARLPGGIHILNVFSLIKSLGQLKLKQKTQPQNKSKDILSKKSDSTHVGSYISSSLFGMKEDKL